MQRKWPKGIGNVFKTKLGVKEEFISDIEQANKWNDKV